MLFARCFLIFLFATFAAASTTDVSRTFALLKEGEQMSPASAEDIETKLVRKPDDLDNRIRLLAFYASQRGSGTPENVRSARLRHITWLVEREPKAAVFNVATRVYALQSVGGALADPAGFQAVKEIWLSQIRANPSDKEIKENAATFTEIQDPETAENLLTELGNTRWLGQVYAKAILGIVASDYISSDPILADESRRNAAFAKRALAQLESSQDARMLGGAAFTLCRDGGILYAGDKLNFDYTPLAKQLLARAESIDPANADVFSVVPELPKKGERPTPIVRIGGNFADKNLRSRVSPSYPPQARAAGVQGDVLVNILIGLDGHVIRVAPVSGPNELRDAAISAIKEWTYSPTLINGRAVYVITQVVAHFRL